MNIVKMILDFILSMSRMFFREKKSERQFCKKCGALVGNDGHCRCCNETDRDSPGSSGSDHGGGSDTEEATLPPQDFKTDKYEDPENEYPYPEEITNRLIGWALIGVAFWRIVA